MMNERIFRSIEAVRSELKDLADGEKPKGGEKFDKRIAAFLDASAGKLFIPWAAPPSGRTEVSGYETATLDWLFGDNGVTDRLSKFFDVQCLVMPADSYAK